MAKETHQFQAETKKLLDLMIHSIYTNREIFLRELISNASDAIDKLHFESLTNRDLLEGNSDYEIFLIPDEASHTLTISDNGLGMNREELIENLGTIAKSGTKAFLEKLQQAKENGLLKRMYWSLRNRVFAAFSPENYTSTVDENAFNKAAEFLNQHFHLGLVLTGNWLQKNYELMHEKTKAKV